MSGSSADRQQRFRNGIRQRSQAGAETGRKNHGFHDDQMLRTEC